MYALNKVEKRFPGVHALKAVDFSVERGEVVVAPGRSYFDTNVEDHHHFFYEDDGSLQDIPGDQVTLAAIPEAPADAEVARIDVIVRLRRANENHSQ